MESFKNLLSTVGCFAYFVMGIVQIVAVIAGFEAWWGWNGFFAVIGAVIVGYIPILGTVMGIMGAIKGWHWSPLAAIALFCWPLILYIVAIALGGLADIAGRRK